MSAPTAIITSTAVGNSSIFDYSVAVTNTKATGPPIVEITAATADKEISEKTNFSPAHRNKNERYITEQSHKIEARIKRREENINRRFDRLISSTTDCNNDPIYDKNNTASSPEDEKSVAEEEEFNEMSSKLLTAEDEETACHSFENVLADNFTEDQSEEWISNESLVGDNNPLPDDSVITTLTTSPTTTSKQDRGDLQITVGVLIDVASISLC